MVKVCCMDLENDEGILICSLLGLVALVKTIINSLKFQLHFNYIRK